MSDFAANAGDDRQLLRRYAESSDQVAFRDLVKRYSGLVYGVAMRKSNDADVAADVSQNVFTALARKSRSLADGAQGLSSVGAWLHRAATLEAKNLLRARSLATQRKKMIQEHFQPDESGNESARESIRPYLDEALAALRTGDRQVVILRFYDGLDFPEVAQRLGIGLAAVQKRSQRALGKLSRSLRRRGVAVSTVALAALLTPELARAAPAALIARMATLPAAASGGTITTTTLYAMTLFGKSVSGGALAAIILLAALLGTGSFVAIRHDSPAKDSAAPTKDTNSSPRLIATGEPQATPPGRSRTKPGATPAAGEEAGGIDATFKRLRHLSTLRQKIMTEARALMQSGGSFESLRGYMLKIEDIDHEALAAFSELAGDYPGALKGFPGDVQGKERDWLLGMLFRSWAGKDPEQALAAAREHGTAASRGAWSGWGASDPEKAMAMQREIAAGDAGAGQDALLRIFGGWISADPAKATKALEGLPPEDRKQAAKAFDDALQSESLRPALLAAAASVEDESLRIDLAREFCKTWGKIAPDEAMAWFDTLSFENPSQALPAAMDIVRGFARSDWMSRGADWIWPKLPEEMRVNFIEEVIAGEWAARDRDRAAAWLRAHGRSEALPAAK